MASHKIKSVLSIAIGCEVITYHEPMARDRIQYMPEDFDKEIHLAVAISVLEENYGVDTGDGDVFCGKYIPNKKWPKTMDDDDILNYLSLCDWALVKNGLDAPERDECWQYPPEWGPFSKEA